MIFQILVTLFFVAIFFMLFSSRQAYFLRVSALIGIVAGVVCVWNIEITARIAAFLGVGRANDLIFCCCILLLLYCFFILYLKQEKAKDDITELARKMAIADALPPED